MRDSMVFYRNFRDALAKLPPDIRLEAYEQIFAYAFDDEDPSDSIAGAVVQMVVPQIDKNNKRYEDGKKGGQYGALGGRPKKNPTETPEKPLENPTETPKCKSVRVEECKSDSVSECKSASVSECESVAPTEPKAPQKRFRAPTVEEVEAYCLERNNRVNAERFVDYYTSNGWKVGKNPMKDWKAAVRSWERREDEKKSNVVEMTKGQQARAAQNEILKKMYQGIL